MPPNLILKLALAASVTLGALGPHLASAQETKTVAAEIGPIEIVAPFARASLPNAPTGGAYFTLVNNGAEDDRLVSVTSPGAESVDMHEMKIEDNVAIMRKLTDGIVLPAGESTVLEPSGTHLMLNHLVRPLVEGEQLKLTLVFEQAGELTLDLPIASFAARSAP
ncbi:copper chaperone PCu(A)C [Devosia sp.]|uniref:copper chaperone PCu(A)C n=1 Tax=Devosia sp. TaxID=1871048 RepID=UPI003A94B1E0